jgi:hypothetical protein
MGFHTVAPNMSCPCTKMSAWWWLLVTETCSIIYVTEYTGWFQQMDSISYIVCRSDEEPVPAAGGMAWTANGASTHGRQLVAVFQVLCLLYRLTCVGYAQNSLEFISHSPLIHVVSQSFCLYTDSLFAQIGDSNDKCFSLLEVECWNKDETHTAQQSPTQF